MSAAMLRTFAAVDNGEVPDDCAHPAELRSDTGICQACGAYLEPIPARALRRAEREAAAERLGVSADQAPDTLPDTPIPTGAEQLPDLDWGIEIERNPGHGPAPLVQEQTAYQRSQDLIARAEAAKGAGDETQARACYLEAARTQWKWVQGLPVERLRTRSVFGLSAATLFYRAGDKTAAEDVARQLLSDPSFEPSSQYKLGELIGLISRESQPRAEPYFPTVGSPTAPTWTLHSTKGDDGRWTCRCVELPAISAEDCDGEKAAREAMAQVVEWMAKQPVQHRPTLGPVDPTAWALLAAGYRLVPLPAEVQAMFRRST